MQWDIVTNQSFRSFLKVPFLTGRLISRENIGKTAEEFVAMWRAGNPTHPIEYGSKKSEALSPAPFYSDLRNYSNERFETSRYESFPLRNGRIDGIDNLG
jgi:hypothetical protein